MTYFGTINLIATIFLISVLSTSIKCFNDNTVYKNQNQGSYYFSIILLLLLVIQVLVNFYFIYKNISHLLPNVSIQKISHPPIITSNSSLPSVPNVIQPPTYAESTTPMSSNLSSTPDLPVKFTPNNLEF